MKNYLKIKHAINNNDFSLSVAEKIYKRLGSKTEIVALVNGVNPLEVTDKMLNDYDEISTKRI